MSTPPPPSISAYSNLPTLSEWKKDSFVGTLISPKRSADPVLSRIDTLVNTLPKAKNSGEIQYLLGELFFATTYWNNHHKADPRMDSRRRPAIMRLFLYSANMLASVHGCGLSALAARLTMIYGKAMGTGGRNTDSGNTGHYLKDAERESFKIIFKNRKAYRFDWQKRIPKAPLIVADTGDYEELHKDKEKAGGGDCGYAMSMSGELYVAPFDKMMIDNVKVPKFHSSFMAGRPVLSAGAIAIRKGIVTYINNFSGHYGPADTALVRVIEQLRLVGMAPKEITVHGYPGVNCQGDEFLENHGQWENILKQKFKRAYERLTATGLEKGKKQVSFRKLVKEEFEALKSYLGSTRSDQALWEEAYKTVCLGLGFYNPEYTAKAKRPPIPMTEAPSAKSAGKK